MLLPKLEDKIMLDDNSLILESGQFVPNNQKDKTMNKINREQVKDYAMDLIEKGDDPEGVLSAIATEVKNIKEIERQESYDLRGTCKKLDDLFKELRENNVQIDVQIGNHPTRLIIDYRVKITKSMGGVNPPYIITLN